jgi:hypothetical protein
MLFGPWCHKDIMLFGPWCHKDNAVWSLVPQGHNGVSIILNWCKYDLMLPWAVTMDVKCWVMFFFFGLVYQQLPESTLS